MKCYLMLPWDLLGVKGDRLHEGREKTAEKGRNIHLPMECSPGSYYVPGMVLGAGIQHTTKNPRALVLMERLFSGLGHRWFRCNSAWKK